MIITPEYSDFPTFMCELKRLIQNEILVWLRHPLPACLGANRQYHKVNRFYEGKSFHAISSHCSLENVKTIRTYIRSIGKPYYIRGIILLIRIANFLSLYIRPFRRTNFWHPKDFESLLEQAFPFTRSQEFSIPSNQISSRKSREQDRCFLRMTVDSCCCMQRVFMR